jgi:hypothetical protein
MNMSAAKDQEAESNEVPPHLLADQLLRMVRECGFDDEDARELMEAAGQNEPNE